MSSELDRLEAIQRYVDSYTRGILEALPMIPSWDCLELGAGAGSIAYWLAGRCPNGRVVATDIDTRYLDPTRAPNLDIRQVDITRPDHEAGLYNLIHARYLFCHLPERDAVVERAVRWLHPGGWLVIEEPYLLPPETSPFPLVSRLMAGYEAHYAARGADLKWARGLPAVLARAGLSDVAFSGNVGCMGCGDADRWRPLIRQTGPILVADGRITPEDLSGFYQLLEDRSFVDIPQITISAWGRMSG